MSQAQLQRAACCDALTLAGPDAATLCEGWTTHDLAAHLWLRENDALAALGIGLAPLAGLTRARMDDVKRLLSYAELVAAVRGGPPRLSPFGLPGMDEAANVLEFFVHDADVRRGGAALPDRPRDPAFEESVWRRLPLLGKLLFRAAPVGLVLERDDVPAAEPLRVRAGDEIVTLVGAPSELVLYGFGRTSAARVDVIASAPGRALFDAMPLGV